VLPSGHFDPIQYLNIESGHIDPKATQGLKRSKPAPDFKKLGERRKGKKITLLLIPVGKFFSAFNPSLVIQEQWAAVKHPGRNWGFSVLLKDTSICNYGESRDRTEYLVVAGRPLSPMTAEPKGGGRFCHIWTEPAVSPISSRCAKLS